MGTIAMALPRSAARRRSSLSSPAWARRHVLAACLASVGAYYAAMLSTVFLSSSSSSSSAFVGAPLRTPRHLSTARSFFGGGSPSGSGDGTLTPTVTGVKKLMGDNTFEELRAFMKGE